MYAKKEKRSIQEIKPNLISQFRFIVLCFPFNSKMPSVQLFNSLHWILSGFTLSFAFGICDRVKCDWPALNHINIMKLMCAWVVCVWHVTQSIDSFWLPPCSVLLRPQFCIFAFDVCVGKKSQTKEWKNGWWRMRTNLIDTYAQFMTK